MANMFRSAGQQVASKIGAKKIADVARAAGDQVDTETDTEEKTPEEVEKDIEDYLRDRLLSGGRRGGVTDMSSILGPARMRQVSPPMYDPAKLYGGLYSSYGGQKVRGGLFGD